MELSAVLRWLLGSEMDAGCQQDMWAEALCSSWAGTSSIFIGSRSRDEEHFQGPGETAVGAEVIESWNQAS